MHQTEDTTLEFLALNDLTTLDHTMIAQRLTAPAKRAISEGLSAENPMWRIWNAIVARATGLVYDSKEAESLLEVVKEVQKMEVQKDGKVVEVWGAKAWKEMPVFGAAIREDWNRSPEGGSKSAFKTEEWTNLNAFLARLTASGVTTLDFGLYGIWTLRDAVEQNEIGKENIDGGKMWLQYAGEKFYAWSKEGKTFEGNRARGGEKYREKDWKGFTEERLELWKSELAKV